LKVWDAIPALARTPVYDMRIQGDAGAVLRFSAYQQAVQALAWIVDAAALEAELRQALRYAANVTPMGEEGVQAPLQVLADGKASANRAAVGVTMALQPYRHRAVAARLVADAPHLGLAHQWLAAPDVLALLPFDHPEPAHSYAMVWSVPDARAEELLALDDAAFEHQLMVATAGVAGNLRLASPRAGWPLAVGRSSAVCGTGWVLLGDAAHVMHPLAGQGLNLGLADVAALAQVLSEREPWRALGDDKLLRRYQRQRELPTQAMLGMTDALWQLFAQPHPVARELRHHGMGLVEHLPGLKRFLAARAFHS
jgi:ubiquinone biosynthesis UbiH/UbiF/VisC/COQ6 family hydroxylase